MPRASTRKAALPTAKGTSQPYLIVSPRKGYKPLSSTTRNGKDDDRHSIEYDSEPPSDNDFPEDDELDEDYGGGATGRRKKAAAPAGSRKVNGGAKKKAASGNAKGTTKGPGRVRAARTGKGAASAKGRGVTAASKEEILINDDNALFNAIKNEEAALQVTAEDWVVKYQKDASEALAELVMFILRCCGCNSVIDGDKAQDHDGIIDALDDIQEEFKKEAIPSYPLVSRAKSYKGFRKSLSEFIERLMSSTADAEILYDDVLVDTFKAWVSALSSSSLRSFRHTSTAIALWSISSLAAVSDQLRKDLVSATKQRDAERRKAGSDKARYREIEKRLSGIKANKESTDGFIEELIHSVFVHRYRDADASIRADCVEELGNWMKRFPVHFQQNSYFRYLGWVYSDSDSTVRITSIHASAGLYAREDSVNKVRHFTEMFRSRLVQMATCDVDLRVRVATIGLLVSIDQRGFLEEEHQQALAGHIFSPEPRIRNAVADFLAGLVAEETLEKADELRNVDQHDEEEKEKEVAKLRFKVLAKFLVDFEKSVDAEQAAKDVDRMIAVDGDDDSEELATVAVSVRDGRIGLAIEALWNKLEGVQDWAACVELLLYDHSVGRKSNNKAANKRARTNGVEVEALGDAPNEEAYRLEAVEEGVLIEALICILRCAQKQAAEVAASGDTQDTTGADLTRVLIDALPKLLTKYRTDAPRVSDVLLIPQTMHLGTYLEVRQLNAYEALWDDVTDHFTRHTEPTLLRNAVGTIAALNATTQLTNVNVAKMTTLEERLVGELREAVKGRDVETAGFSEDEVHKLSACLRRINTLFPAADLTNALEEDDSGKVTSGWDVVLALATRGNLGYREEQKMVEDALSVLALLVFWKTKAVAQAAPDDRSDRLQPLIEKRETLLELLNEYVEGKASNARAGVQRVALERLLHVHLLYTSLVPMEDAAEQPVDGADAPSTFGLPGKLPSQLRLKLSDEAQARCAGLAQSEIERYSEVLASDLAARKAAGMPADEEESSDSDSSEESEQDEDADITATLNPSAAEKSPSASKKTKATKKTKRKPSQKTSKDIEEVDARPSLQNVAREHAFIYTISAVVTALRVGVLDISYARTLLAYHGRLGSLYDAVVRVLVDTLREEGIWNKRAEETCKVVLGALQDSFAPYLETPGGAIESRFVGLARALSSAFVVRGAQLAVVKSLPPAAVLRLHSSAVDWVCEKIAAREKGSGAKKGGKPQVFFKGLALLLVSAGPKDALKIKMNMDRLFIDAKIEVSASSKVWDAQRSYEKRLLTIASKDARLTKEVPVAAGKSSARSMRAITPARELGAFDDLDDLPREDVTMDDDTHDVSRSRPRPRPHPVAKRTADDMIGDDEEEGDMFEMSLSRSRSKRSRLGLAADQSASREGFDLGEEEEEGEGGFGFGLGGDAEEEEEEEQDEEEVEDEDEDARSASPVQSEISLSDVQGGMARRRRV